MAARQTLEEMEESPPIFTTATPPREAADVLVYQPGTANLIATSIAEAKAREEQGGVLGAIADAAKAVGSVASTVVKAADAVIDVAATSVVAQAGAAILTGGLSLVAQAGYEAATGKTGPVLGTLEKAVNDPLKLVSELPGLALTELGLIGAAADVASALGGVVNVVAPNTPLGNLGRDVQAGVEGVQQAAKDNPEASLQIIGGIAAAAAGLPGGRKLIDEGIKDLLGLNKVPPVEQAVPPNGNTGFVPPAATAPQPTVQQVPASAQQAGGGLLAMVKNLSPGEMTAAATVLLGVAGLGVWAAGRATA